MSRFLKYEPAKNDRVLSGNKRYNPHENAGYVSVDSVVFHDPNNSIIELVNGTRLVGKLHELSAFDRNPLVVASRQAYTTAAQQETVVPGVPGQKALAFSCIGDDHFFSEAKVDLYDIIGWRILDDMTPPSPVMLGFKGNPRHVRVHLVNPNGTVLSPNGSEHKNISEAIADFQKRSDNTGQGADAYGITYGIGFSGVTTEEGPRFPPDARDPRRDHLPPLKAAIGKPSQKSNEIVF